MAGRWQWRAAVLVTVGLVLGGQQLAASAGGNGRGDDRSGESQHDDDGRSKAEKDAKDAAHDGQRDDRGRGRKATKVARGNERYNPDIDGDRVVFTKVTRRPDGSSAAAVWSRDLVSGRESLVADVATGEPYPVASADWTVWSEVGTGEPPTTVVRARSTANGSRPFDVYATDYPGGWSFPPGPTALPSVDVSGNHVATTGSLLPDGGRQLVRFDLPSTRPAFVDVMATAPATLSPGVAQSGTTSVIGLGNGTLFSIVDGTGAVVASPTAAGDCQTFGPSRPVIDGDRVAMFAYCATSGPSVLTCTLPCDRVDAVPVDPALGFPSAIGLSGSVVTWSFTSGQPTAFVVVLDLARGGPPRIVHRTSGSIGPRVSISGTRIVWDETMARDGVTTTELYLHDLATGRTVVLSDGGGTVPVGNDTGPVRLAPDVRGTTFAYTEVARDGASAGIWTRTLGGAATLVSTVATDGSAARIGTGWLAWNVADPANANDRVVATSGPGAPLIDVYATDLNGSIFGYSPESPARATVDVAGNRVIVNGATLVEAPFFPGARYPQPSVFAKDLPGGPLAYVAPAIAPFSGSTSQASSGRTNGRWTAEIETGRNGGTVVLFDGAGPLREIGIPPSGPFNQTCVASALDLTDTRLVVATFCFGEPSALLSCTLPCTGGLTNRVVLPDLVDPLVPGAVFPAFVNELSASGTKAVVARFASARAGRSGDRVAEGTRLELYDVVTGGAPVTLAVESGEVSAPRLDGSTVTWSVDRWDGTRSGTVYVYDVARRRTTTF